MANGNRLPTEYMEQSSHEYWNDEDDVSRWIRNALDGPDSPDADEAAAWIALGVWIVVLVTCGCLCCCLGCACTAGGAIARLGGQALLLALVFVGFRLSVSALSGVAPLVLLLLVGVSLAWVVCTVQQLRQPVAIYSDRQQRAPESYVVVDAIPVPHATESTPLRPQSPGEPALPAWAAGAGSDHTGGNNGGRSNGGYGSGNSRDIGNGAGNGDGYGAVTEASYASSYASNTKKDGGSSGSSQQSAANGRYAPVPSAPPDEEPSGGV